MMKCFRFSVWLGPLAILGFAVAPAGALDIRAGADTVVELFTSQGCSRCPDADLLLSELALRQDIVALAYHVDYWDYIGWQDTFALPGNAGLQKGYAQAWGKNRIYTPQMVINGTHAVVGSDAGEAGRAIAAARTPVALSLQATNADTVVVTAPGDTAHQPSVVWVVTYRETAEVVVERGENSGRVLPYTHIVTGRQAVGMWDPEAGANLTIPLAEVLGSHSDGAAVIIQEKNGDLPGPIIAASAFNR